MRTYGRVLDPQTGKRRWVEVSTNASGTNDYVWLTTLIQCLNLVLGESPFYSNYGIPSPQAVIQQIAPDFYVAVTQQQFAAYFASLLVAKQPGRTPTYRISVTTQQGVKMAAEVAL